MIVLDFSGYSRTPPLEKVIVGGATQLNSYIGPAFNDISRNFRYQSPVDSNNEKTKNFYLTLRIKNSTENIKNTIIDKIYYVRYGFKSDPLYFKIGSLDRVDLGYGILVNSYSNAIQYPQVRKVGLDYKIKTKLGTIEGFVNDFKENIGLTGLRVKSPFISSLPFAVSIVIDRNQYLGLRDGDSDGVPDIVDAFPSNSAFSMDSDNDGLADLDPNELDRDGDGYLDAGNLDDIHDWWDNLGNTVGVDFSNETYYDSLPDGNIVLDSDPLNINKNSDPVGAIAVDFGYPLITQEKLCLVHHTYQIKRML